MVRKVILSATLLLFNRNCQQTLLLDALKLWQWAADMTGNYYDYYDYLERIEGSGQEQDDE